MVTTIILVLFLGYSFRGDDGIGRLFELRQAKLDLIANQYHLLEKNLQLRQTLNHLITSDDIEYLAKAHLGLARPDEVVFVVK